MDDWHEEWLEVHDVNSETCGEYVVQEVSVEIVGDSFLQNEQEDLHVDGYVDEQMRDK